MPKKDKKPLEFVLEIEDQGIQTPNIPTVRL
jgi:hypothetical protein